MMPSEPPSDNRKTSHPDLHVRPDVKRITLNNRDRDRLLRALDSDEKPNEALMQAAHDFTKRYGRE